MGSGRGGKIRAGVRLRYGDVGQRCPLCVAPENRRDWGCDEEAASTVFEITCPECNGSLDETCPRCSGSGKFGYRRCPAKIIDREVVELLDAYRDYKLGHWPSEGGRGAQTCSFMLCVSIIEGEIAKIEEEREDRREAARRMRSLGSVGAALAMTPSATDKA